MDAADKKKIIKEKSALPEEYRQGFAIFCGCRIDLSRRVLIPRPETEFMARYAIRDLLISGIKKPRVLDIFSGSGCLGVAAAKNVAGATVDFSDIDPVAAEQIKINIGINGIESGRARVFVSDIFSAIPTDAEYDIILANPPYVDPARMGEVQESVLEHEPAVALFGGREGLEVISRFLEQAKKRRNKNGTIYMEFDPRQSQRIKQILDGFGYKRYDLFKDQFGFLRFVKIAADL